MSKQSQYGFSHVVILLAIVVLTGIGAVGWRVSRLSSTAVSTTPVAGKAATPATIKSKADVVQASKALDETPIDKNVDPSSLDADLQASL